ncbi:hypothetical protein R4Z09_30115 [Niallia oryzisoli]|uniref:Uncharacterized protein n=1 Tax=Niallia oryzisoli TaxID=1737571 RepID=A0ABZ2CC79_9BACI
MKKWALSAIVYLLVVVGVYYAYTGLAESPADGMEHKNTEQHAE